MLDEGQRSQDLNITIFVGLLLGHNISSFGLLGLTLEARGLLTLGSALGTDSFVLLDAGQKVITALGVTDVLDADVEALLQLAAVDDLVDLDTDGVGGNVEHNTGATVVVGKGHTLLDGRISDNVDVLATLELGQVAGQGRHALLAESLGELTARVAALTSGRRHG